MLVDETLACPIYHSPPACVNGQEKTYWISQCDMRYTERKGEDVGSSEFSGSLEGVEG